MKLHLCFFQLLLMQIYHCASEDNHRYLFYMINPGEGCNLRRDVFMRIAIMVNDLNQLGNYNFTLVLPQWNQLYHWQTRELGEQVDLPWGLFFDVPSIRRFVPVIEFDQYRELVGDRVIETMFVLQRYIEGWKDGNFEEKLDFRDCIDPVRLHENEDGTYSGLREYRAARVAGYKCLSLQGFTPVIHSLIEEMSKKSKGILIDRAETLLHKRFGDSEYWKARRSMRYAKHLVEIANDFRKSLLNSTDEEDKTVRSPKWEDFQPARGTAIGGPYIALHFRRKDYLYARKDKIPSLQFAAEQMKRKLDEYKLNTLFVATDAPNNEFIELQNHLEGYNVYRFYPTKEIHNQYKDGGVAIIDQIICSHARLFIGSIESTFTFRIQEDREILGFPVETTFQILCPEGKFDCEKGSVWKIAYPDPKHEEL